MGSVRSKRLNRQRRGSGRAAVFLLAALATVAGGCGRQGHGADTDSEKAADVAVLNSILAQELTTVAAYEQGLPALHGQMLTIGRIFRGQDQAHVDALTKAIRGLGGETEADASELEPPGPQSQIDALTLAFDEENVALSEAQTGVAHLQFTAPRTLSSALAASHAQHLAIFRQGFGSGLAGAVPQAFESGDEPPPRTSVDGPETSK
jgi:Ferritin-like domain